jgi:hypothetical protein
MGLVKLIVLERQIDSKLTKANNVYPMLSL